MFIYIIFTFLILFIINIALFYKARYRYWKNRGYTFKAPIPFFGNYASFFLFRKTYWEVDQEIYREFPNDNLIGAFMGHSRNLIVKDPELIKHIMTKDFNNFYHRGFNADVEREPLVQNLFETSGDRWKVLRQHLTPLFSSSKLKSMFYLIVDSCNEFDKYLKQQTIVSNVQNIRDLTSKLTLDVIGSCAFGLQMNTMSPQSNEFHRMGYKIFEAAPPRFLKLLLRQFFPKLFYALRLNSANEGVEEFFIQLVREIILQRKSQKDRELRHDFIDLIIEIYDKGRIIGDSIEHFSHDKEPSKVEIKADFEMITAQCFIFFGAGFETSSTTMSYALFELAHNNEIQRKVQVEIDDTLKKNNGSITYDNIQTMKYLEMVFDETLRKYPVIATLTRKCMNKYNIAGLNKFIDKDVVVRIPVHAIHHDERYYPNPENFNPERFTEEEKSKRHRYCYLPFGEGPRICIGLRFAKLQAMAGLVTILKNFNVEPAEKSKMPLKFDPKTFITTAVGGVWLKLTPRK